MSRSPQALKRVLSSQQIKAYTFSLYNTSSTYLSLLLSPLPFLRRLLYKTLSFFSCSSSSSMEPFLFSSPSPSPLGWDDDFAAFDPPPPLPPSPETMFLVPFRWWSEANAAIYGDREITGVLYNVTSCLRNKMLEKEDSEPKEESEIVLEMRTAGQTGTSEEEGVSGSDSTPCLAFISEWMFLRAFKWHNDRKDVGGFLAYGSEDLFSLQIRLFLMIKENSFYLRISDEDNDTKAFVRACDIFCTESGLLQIWDFSGQPSQFLMNEQKSSSVSDQPGNDILLKLEVYALSLVEASETKRDKLMVEQFKNGVPSSSGSLKMNGSADYVNSYSRVNQSSLLGGIFSNARRLGLTGLSNLGNTCFMNSALQCLVHTTEFVDYFLSDFHKDLNFENPLGMNGNLARAFGDLLRKLWTPGATAVAPREFKSMIARFAPQFSGYNQHDSQEFLSFLLDGLHEDLNRVKSKPYIEVKDGDGRPDEEVADEHWRNHLARNDSIIVHLCQGQYRSRVVCPVCKKVSITFDPFMYLSLPLPSTTTRTMTLTVVSSDGATLPSPVTVTVPKPGNLKDLVQALSIACSLGDDETLVVAEVYDNTILRFLEDPSDTLELIRDNDQLIAYRLPKDSESCTLVVFAHYYQEKSVIPGLPSRKKFGIPLVSRMSNFYEETETRKEFLKLVRPFLMPVEASLKDKDDTHIIDKEDLGTEDAILDHEENLHREFESDSTNTLKDDDLHMDEPFSMSSTFNAVNILVSWPEKMLEDYDTVLLNSLPEVLCKPAGLLKKPEESVSLYNCLHAFLKEEPLGADDMWYCPSCKSHRQASKRLDLWRLPEILVIHLKRFSYNRSLKDKLETFVNFPVDDFDLSNYMIHKDSSISHRYMLYAVSNHYGSMGSGHYTAFVQHWGRWHDFDDSVVYPVSEEQIKTPAAYVLFYRRISDTV